MMTKGFRMAWLKYKPPTDESNKCQVQAALNTCRDAGNRALFTISNAKDPAKIEAAEHDIPLLNAESTRLYALPVMYDPPAMHRRGPERPIPPVVKPRDMTLAAQKPRPNHFENWYRMNERPRPKPTLEELTQPKKPDRFPNWPKPQEPDR